MTLPASTSFNTRSVATRTGPDSENNTLTTSSAEQQGQMAVYEIAQTEMPCRKALPEANDGLLLSSPTGQIRERQVASTSDQTSAPSLTKTDTKPIDSWEYLRNLSASAGNPILDCPEVEFALKYINAQGEFPPLSQAVTFLNMPCMKKGWSGDDQAVANNPIDLPKLMRFSTVYKNTCIARAANEAKPYFLGILTD